MFANSIVARTGQAWKFWLGFIWQALGAIAMWGGLQWHPVPWLVLGGLATTILATIFQWSAIRCRRCGARWLWMAVRTQKASMWFRWLRQQAKCPRCGYDGGASDAEQP